MAMWKPLEKVESQGLSLRDRVPPHPNPRALKGKNHARPLAPGLPPTLGLSVILFIKIKGRFNYAKLQEISIEGRQKLQRIDPETLAQASRIPGVSPSDINVLLVLLGR